ncbi:histidine--tRNA ligase [Thermocrinis sp.]
MEEFRSVRGFHDLLGEDTEKFNTVRQTVRRVLESHNFEEIILPVVEYAEVFQRSIGEATDIVQKEMFVFPDKKGRLLALRPEGTAGVVRAFIQHRLFALRPYTKLFYEGPMFRYERPQAGRYRQFHQVGAEVFGISDPLVDAEIINISYKILKELKIDCTVEINSIGCRVCRPDYRKALTEYLESVAGALCEDCIDRKDRNPLRVLDCKVPACKTAVKEAPRIGDFLCEECEKHRRELTDYLNSMGIPYVENPNLVRGLDYYTRTVFEMVSQELGITVIAGGRYDYLVEEMGGAPTPAVGFAVGVERLAMLVKEPVQKKPLYMVLPMGDTLHYALRVCELLRESGKRVELSYRKGGLKKQLELANRLRADYAVIVGEDEVKEENISVKNLHTGEQIKVSLKDIFSAVL